MTWRLVTLWCRPGDISLQQVSLHSRSAHQESRRRALTVQVSRGRNGWFENTLEKTLKSNHDFWGSRLNAVWWKLVYFVLTSYNPTNSLVNLATANPVPRVKHVITQMPGDNFVDKFITFLFVCLFFCARLHLATWEDEKKNQTYSRPMQSYTYLSRLPFSSSRRYPRRHSLWFNQMAWNGYNQVVAIRL